MKEKTEKHLPTSVHLAFMDLQLIKLCILHRLFSDVEQLVYC